MSINSVPLLDKKIFNTTAILRVMLFWIFVKSASQNSFKQMFFIISESNVVQLFVPLPLYSLITEITLKE